MRRALLVGFGCAASACSLVYGLHDNQGPLDADADVAVDAPLDAPPDVIPWNGCPEDAGQHLFCEFFDESPSWPADGGMPGIEGKPTLVEAGCDTPPRCLSANTLGDATRSVSMSNVGYVYMQLHVRFDAVAPGPVARPAWVDIDTGSSSTSATFGVTVLNNGSLTQIYLFWSQGTTIVGSGTLQTVSVGQWYDLTLVVDIQGQSASLSAAGNATPATRSFAQMTVSLSPSQVKGLLFHAGNLPEDAGVGLTVDSVVADVH